MSKQKKECDRLSQHYRNARSREFGTPLERMQYHLYFEKGGTEKFNDRWDDSEVYYNNINDNIGIYFDPIFLEQIRGHI